MPSSADTSTGRKLGVAPPRSAGIRGSTTDGAREARSPEACSSYAGSLSGPPPPTGAGHRRTRVAGAIARVLPVLPGPRAGPARGTGSDALQLLAGPGDSAWDQGEWMRPPWRVAARPGAVAARRDWSRVSGVRFGGCCGRVSAAFFFSGRRWSGVGVIRGGSISRALGVSSSVIASVPRRGGGASIDRPTDRRWGGRQSIGDHSESRAHGNTQESSSTVFATQASINVGALRPDHPAVSWRGHLA